MVARDTELDIIDLFFRDISLSYSINQIAAKLKKPYPFIHNKVTTLIESGVIKKQEIGRSHLCRLNLDSDETIALVILLNKKKKQELLETLTPSLKNCIDSAKNDPDTDFIIFSKDKNRIFIAQNHLKLVDQNIQKHVQNINFDLFEQLVLSDKRFLQETTIISSYEKYFQYLSRLEDKILLNYSPLIKK